MYDGHRSNTGRKINEGTKQEVNRRAVYSMQKSHVKSFKTVAKKKNKHHHGLFYFGKDLTSCPFLKVKYSLLAEFLSVFN